VKVTTILVSHNGSRWLPAVLGGLQDQSRPSEQFVVVDTGSTDDSVARIEAAGLDILHADSKTNYPQAVSLALDSLAPAEPDEWIWLLQDDSNPDPECLSHLVSAAGEAGPEYAAIGPKLREWPSLRRLLEVGVTITGTGQRETHLLPGEYDQGQHDNIHPSLAANTAGLLIRRSALTDLPLDPNLPLFFGDIDLGWRLAKAGLAIVIEPRAVVFHAEAATRGLRDTASVRHPRAMAREAATYTILVNSPAWTLPFKAIRLLFGGLLRVLGLLLVRALDDAIDELVGLFRGLSRWGRIRAGRAQRRGEAQGHNPKSLLAPWWLPYAHGGDFVSDVWSGISESVKSVFDDETHEQSIWKRLLLSPSTWGLVVATLLAVTVNFGWLGAGSLHGGALLRAPDDVRHWWSLWSQGWHWLGNGTTAPAAPYVGLMALGSLFTFGSPGTLVWLILVLAVPLSMIGALAFSHRLLHNKWSRLFLAGAYAALPAVSGAVAQGRLGTTVALILLPWPALSALNLVSPSSETRTRAAWRTALGAGLVVMFVPASWLFLVLLLLLSPWLTGHRLRPRVWLPILLLPLAFCAPWLLQTLQAPYLWLFEAGWPTQSNGNPGLLEFLVGRTGGPGSAPAWLAVLIPVLALTAWLLPTTRRAVEKAWLVASAAAVFSLLSLLVVSLPGLALTAQPWVGFGLVLMQAGWLIAIAVTSEDLLDRFIQMARPAKIGVAVATLAAVIGPLAGLTWWAVNGHNGQLSESGNTAIPTYMQDLASRSNQNAILVLNGGSDDGPVRTQLLRKGHLVLGDESVLMATRRDVETAQVVADLLVNPNEQFAKHLSAQGITYVYAPRPVSDAISGAVDAAPGLISASEPRPGTRAWQVVDSGEVGLRAQDNWWHPLLLTIQVFAGLVALVQVLPSDLRRRRVS
jgi:GT2 family glycosyltransferase